MESNQSQNEKQSIKEKLKTRKQLKDDIFNEVLVENSLMRKVKKLFYLADLFSYGYGTSVGFAINMN